MRRIAPSLPSRFLPSRRVAPTLLVLLALGGCNYVGNPADGFGSFAGDVFSLRDNPNKPLLDSPNGRRVMGAEVEIEPLAVEPGNVWPGPLPPARTIGDLQRDQSQMPPIDGAPPRPPVRGGGTPPTPGASFDPSPAPSPARAGAVPTASAAQPTGRVLQTPGGPATTIIGGNGVETYTLPSGRTGIVMPNANGTLTLIGPDGTTQTVPAPR